MKKIKPVLGFAVASLIILPQCDFFKSGKAEQASSAEISRGSAAAHDKSEVLMSINGKPAVTKDSFEMYMQEFLDAQPQYKQIVEFMPDAKRNIFDGQVNEEVINEWAEKHGIAARAEFKKDLDKIIKFAKRSLNVKYFQDANPVMVSAVEVRKYYDENKNSPQLMKAPGGTKSSVVMFPDHAKADAFVEQAKTLGFDKAAQEAGLKVKDLGMITKQSYEVEGPIREAILAVKSYPMVEMVMISDKSYAVINVQSFKNPEYVSFEEVKEGIENFLKQQKVAEELQKVIEKLKKEYSVAINDAFFERDKKAQTEEAEKAAKIAQPAAKPVAKAPQTAKPAPAPKKQAAL